MAQVMLYSLLTQNKILHEEVTVQSEKDQPRKISIVAESVEMNMPHQMEAISQRSKTKYNCSS
jgi:hypothetical protein